MKPLRKIVRTFLISIFFVWPLAAGATISIPLFGWHLNLAKANRSRAIIAIIIDDLGYSYYKGKQCVEFPGELTLSVIPFTPHGTRLANAAHREGKEVMLHVPMETLHQDVWEPSLDRGMDQHELIANLGAMIQNIPHISGVNNHGGSLFTQDVMRMGWLMSALSKSGLFFIDSRTTPLSVAGVASKQYGIPSDSRDIFLDNVRTPANIESQLLRLKEIALKNGHALAIGHPYGETLSVLSQQLPLFQLEGIQLLPVSEYLQRIQAREEI